MRYRWNVPVTLADVAAFFGVPGAVADTLRRRLRDERLMSTVEVAHMVGVGVDTLERWRADGYGPPWVKLGRAARTIGGTEQGRRAQRARTLPRYKRADVMAWIEMQRVDPAKE